NDGLTGFRDEAFPMGVAQPSLTFLTFGVFFWDFDLDGWQDIFTANGHIDDLVNKNDSVIVYAQRPLLYRNEGGRFTEIGETAGSALQTKIIGRGCAWGDFTMTGKPDLVVVSNHGRGFLWKNSTTGAGSWIGLKLRGVKSNRDGLGAKIKVVSGGLTQTMQTYCGGSFLSTRQAWPLFGLGHEKSAEVVEITWPGGIRTTLRNLQAGRYYEIEEGRTDAVPLAPHRR